MDQPKTENADNSGNNFKKSRLSTLTNNRTSNEKSNFSKKLYNYKSREDNTGNTSTSTSTTDNRLSSFRIPRNLKNDWTSEQVTQFAMFTEKPVGGRLKFFSKNWELITQDNWVFSVIKDGYKVEFLQKPPFLVVKKTVIPRAQKHC